MDNLLFRRKYIIGGLFVLVALIFVIKLFYLQVLDVSSRISAENNSRRNITNYPARGLVFDRNGNLLVDNEAAYDLMVVPRQLKEFDTLDLCNCINISLNELKQGLKKAKAYNRYKPSVIVKQLSSESYAALQEKLYKFDGFSVQTRTLRKYPMGTAAHLLGYVGEVNDKVIEQDPYYKSGDYVGIKGIEKTYEKYLRGEKGISIYMVDVHNRIKGVYKDGEYNTPAVAGRNLVTTLDAGLQAYGEFLMNNKKGSVVAIEPNTGEILALVSSPSYDPNLLVGRSRTPNFVRMSRDRLKPLYNRAMMAKYPPGSTFKLVNALIGLHEEIITTNTYFTSNWGYQVGNFHMGDHVNGPVSFLMSIQKSSNAYYCNVFRKTLDDKKYGGIENAFQVWYDHVSSFGLGRRLGSDLPEYVKGDLPTIEFYDKRYGVGRWKSLMLVSMAIGQGELGTTPFQMANMTAAIANKGYYYPPHIIKSIQGFDTIPSEFRTKTYTTIDPKYFPSVIDGMELVVQSGTAVRAQIPGIAVCGKTGTAENPHGKDHSIFVAFAPKDNPQIAIAVYVENSGYGSTWAAPIASLMIEKYLTDSISRPYEEERISKANLLDPEETKP